MEMGGKEAVLRTSEIRPIRGSPEPGGAWWQIYSGARALRDRRGAHMGSLQVPGHLLSSGPPAAKCLDEEYVYAYVYVYIHMHVQM